MWNYSLISEERIVYMEAHVDPQGIEVRLRNVKKIRGLSKQ